MIAALPRSHAPHPISGYGAFFPGVGRGRQQSKNSLDTPQAAIV